MVNGKIIVKRFGKVDDKSVNEILNVILECFEQAGRKPSIVDLYIFESRSSMISFLNSERIKHGMPILWEIEEFYATHDAWLGNPRIMVSIDAKMKMPKKAYIGCIRHEAAHSILHGDLKYYLFTIPKSLKKFNYEISQKIAYLLSIGIKDYEVTEFLIKLNFIEDQLAYINFLLIPSENEFDVYNLSELNLSYRALALASILKVVMCALPATKIHRKNLIKIEKYLLKITPKWSKVILNAALEASKEFNCEFKDKLEILASTLMKKLNN
ncbi:MAG: hypothetical protein NDF55_07915 [archaeon GB-1867-005]|nr:hypothetical protein [Candidatus Culexmicrobium cathedralense]